MKCNFKKTVAFLMALMLCAGSVSALAENAVDTVLNAKTTQAFSQEPVSEEDLNTIVLAGTMATSAINQQPWYFAVVTNQEVMDELASSGGFSAPAGIPAGAAPAGAPAQGNPPAGAPDGMPAGAPAGMPAGAPAASSGAKAAMGDSPAAIIIYMNENTSSPNASFDCGLACQNMVIAATALGYGTKIVSSPTMTLNGANHDALCEKLGVDPALTAVAVLLIGVTDTAVDGATGASVRSTLDEKVSFIK